jgi:hypothetical protein
MLIQPQQRPPAVLTRRMFSVAPELYGALRRAHGLMIAAFLLVFPCPIAVQPRMLRRRWLSGRRGDVVTGAAGEGRVVGRHPVTGAAIVAWNPEAYEAMCEAFDTENAARLVAWRDASAILGLSVGRAARWALRADQGLRLMVVLCILVPSLVGALHDGIAGALLWSIAGAAGGLLLFLLLAVVGFFSILIAGGALSVGVGAWGARRARHARASDEAGRSSAAQIVAAMQGRSDREPSERRTGEERSRKDGMIT